MNGSGTPHDPERVAFLQQRNDLWRQLRQLEPNDEHAEVLIQELSSLTGWSRQKILEGLGWA
jgi:predicted site-specific integrase-resolvase